MNVKSRVHGKHHPSPLPAHITHPLCLVLQIESLFETRVTNCSTVVADRGSGNLIPEAEDSQLSARELEYKSLGKAMFMRSNEVPEIKIAVIRDSDPQLVQRVKKLIADMTQIIHQYRPAAEDVLRKLQRLQRIQQG